MSIHRLWFLAGLAMALMLWGANAARAQVRIPRENTLEDMQLFAPVDSNDMSDRPYLREGLFFNADTLLWSVQRPKVTILGNPGETRVVFNQNIFRNFIETNSIDTSMFTDQLEDGTRTEVGYMYDDCGWMVGYTKLHDRQDRFVATEAPIIYADPQGLTAGAFIQITRGGRTFDADLDGDRIYGRDGEDLGTPFPNPLTAPVPPGTVFPTPHPRPFDPGGNGAPGTAGRPPHPQDSLGDGIRPGFYLPYDGIPDSFPNGNVPDFGDLVPGVIDYDDIEVFRITEIWSTEAMFMRRLHRISYGGHWDVFAGVRYTDFEEQFHIEAAGGILADTHINNESINRIVGPQIGARWFKDCCRWRFAVEGRFAPSVNFQAVRLRTDIGDQGLGAAVLVQATSALPFQNTGFDSLHAYEFSPVGELRLNWTYQVTRAIGIRAGYTALYVGNLARASNMIQYVLPNPRLIRDNYLDDCFMQGLNLGIEINR